MKTQNQVASMVGKVGHVFVGGLKVKVFIDDYKFTYGRDRYLVRPVEGSGEIWIEHVELVQGGFNGQD